MIAHDAWFYLMHSAMHACKPLYRHVHRLHHANGSNISTLGSSYGDLLDIGLSFVSFHFVVFLALLQQPSWNLPSMVLLILFEVRCTPSATADHQAQATALMQLWCCCAWRAMHRLVQLHLRCNHPGLQILEVRAASNCFGVHPRQPLMPRGLCAQSMTNLAGHAGYQVPLWLHGLFTGGVGLTPGARLSLCLHAPSGLQDLYPAHALWCWCNALHARAGCAEHQLRSRSDAA